MLNAFSSFSRTCLTCFCGFLRAPPHKNNNQNMFFSPLHLFSLYMETQLQCMATVVITGFNLRFCE